MPPGSSTRREIDWEAECSIQTAAATQDLTRPLRGERTITKYSTVQRPAQVEEPKLLMQPPSGEADGYGKHGSDAMQESMESNGRQMEDATLNKVAGSLPPVGIDSSKKNRGF
ncbi:hypothetical protein Tb09.354.0050 [Trypanosoma brucei brucei TREU927]|uniref:Uncharacterized protein n=1 Tax=Trypanosoma brucei brucei (strain 927/4 GUTat10.1) TaxID=185431 RepID=Q38G48_TRYB2|nr:hypothetical protein Tb09.354.0050 [Trypanosoma brucei brucei TREU927]EAN76222.1 hypothetical protein Tb09.354.0050 [Trypanosoma brucei brucei TREU927]